MEMHQLGDFMKNQIDWSEWILQKNNEAKQEELKKSELIVLEPLDKSAKNNALHRLFRDLAPHVNTASLGHIKEDASGFQHSSTAHPEGLVGVDLEYDNSKKAAVYKILENHGHFRHKKAFMEDYSIDDSERHGYGIMQLHPDRQEILVDGPEVSGRKNTIKPQSSIEEPAIGSANLYESSPTEEGSAKGAKWRGSDPRQKDLEITRAGERVATPSDGNRTELSTTSGQSNRMWDKIPSRTR
jgi:hypothetical protein